MAPTATARKSTRKVTATPSHHRRRKPSSSTSLSPVIPSTSGSGSTTPTMLNIGKAMIGIRRGFRGPEAPETQEYLAQMAAAPAPAPAPAAAAAAGGGEANTTTATATTTSSSSDHVDQELDQLLRKIKVPREDPNLGQTYRRWFDWSEPPLPDKYALLTIQACHDNTVIHVHDGVTREKLMEPVDRLTIGVRRAPEKRDDVKLITIASAGAMRHALREASKLGYNGFVLRMMGFTPGRYAALNIVSRFPGISVHEIQEATPALPFGPDPPGWEPHVKAQTTRIRRQNSRL